MAVKGSRKRSSNVGSQDAGILVQYPDGTDAFLPFTQSADFLIASGDLERVTAFDKFGRNAQVKTTYEVIAADGIYRTPQVADVAALRIAAGNAADTADGAGARSVTIEGLAPDGSFQTATQVTAGATASANFEGQWLRVFDARVASSGSYFNIDPPAQSHAGPVVVEDTAGGVWATISTDNIAHGRALIGAYTVPLGFRAFVSGIDFSGDSSKTMDIVFVVRPNILETETPYTVATTAREYDGISSAVDLSPDIPGGPFPPLTDLMVLARSIDNAIVSTSFSLVLEELIDQT